MMKTLIASTLLTCSLALPALAQDTRPVLSSESAGIIVDGCLAWAEENDIQIIISVYDQGVDLMAFQRMDGAPMGSIEISEWKGRSSANFDRPTAEFAELAPDYPAIYSAPGIATFRGGVPIRTVDGTHIGGVGVSGASSENDERCAHAGIAAAGLASSQIETE